ncbi:MAG: flippase-like domain-containing protein [Anaerolineales bacterium]|nr:flippase-like domain-containing protein [Anaerolineales bacterium]
MRKFIVVVIFFLTVVFIFLSFSELQSIADTLRLANLWLFAVALLVQLVWLYNMGLTFRALYHLIGLEESSRHLTKVATAANFVNVVAPSLGVGGMAIFVSDGKQREHPSGKVTAATALFIIFDYAAFLFVLTLGLIVLIRRDNLTAGEISASIFLLVISLGLAFLIFLGMRSAEKLGAALAALTRFVNKLANPFIHRAYLDEESAYSFAHEIAGGLASINDNRRRLLAPMSFALANKGLLIVVLMLIFIAFNVPFSAGTLIAGFAIGYLFLIVSVTPSGIGIMESALAVGLKSLGVPWSQAVVITLTYRAVTLWFPLGLGGLAFRSLQREKNNG